jgi:TrmH family RNA methyltransferase
VNTPAITSLTNPRVKAAVRLRDRREREATGLTIVDGARAILRALDAGVRVETAFLAPDLVRSADAIAVADRIGRRETTLEVSPDVLAKVAFGDRSDGVVAIVEVPRPALDDVPLAEDPLVVVVADQLTDAFNPNAIRASLGTIFALPVVTASSVDTLAWLGAHGIRPVATIVEASVPYTAADLRGPLAVVLGSEAEGLSEIWRSAGVTAIAIPMAGIADSLNVSVAAAVVLFEAVRQRSAT